MVEYYQKGMTAKEASSKVGSSIKVCLVELKKRGISIRKNTEYSSIKTPQWKLDKMVEYYNKGMSSSEAAKKFGLGYSVCINELKRRNIEIRKPGTYQSPSKDKKDKMIQNYLNGMTSYKAAESIGVSFTTCLKEIKRRGLTARNPQEYTRLSVDDNYFEKINTEEKAYWLGFIVSDGCIFGGNILHFTLKSSDKSHLEKFLKEIKYEGVARDYFTTNGHWVCKVSINSPKIYNDLLKYGITERKSLTIKPFKFKNKKLNIAYWRGIIDGDGWFTKYSNATSACGYIYDIGLCGNIHVIKSFIDFLKSYKISIKNKIVHNGKIRAIKFRRKDTIYEISNLLYKDATIYLDRKYDMYLKFISEYNYKENF